MLIRANIVADTGRRNNLIIAPRNSRAIPITKGEDDFNAESDIAVIWSYIRVGYFIIEPDLAVKSIFGTSNLFTFGSIKESFDIILYNGGFESYFVVHEQLLGRIVPL